MNRKKQWMLSIGLLVVATVVVIVYASRSDGDKGNVPEGHDHAAMTGAASDELSPVQLDADRAARIGVAYTTVERKPLVLTVRTVATVNYDETRLTKVNPKIEGWVERLHVDFTGAPVRRGQPLLDLYSPLLVSAQEELILARRLVDDTIAEPDSRAAERARNLLAAAQRRLAYWDIPADQIERIERVWIEGEVFEKDLSLVREGQAARVVIDAYPGEEFTGVVTYVYPTVSLDARTGRIRVELANPDLKLRPGMYANIGLASPAREEALVVPRSAVHATGEHAYVFVRGADDVLSAREVTTGLVSGNEIEILRGVEEGEQVVSSANFLIDAESSRRERSRDAAPRDRMVGREQVRRAGVCRGGPRRRGGGDAAHPA
jgi:Cu(I)/Ag(I) efflux system membrane fusion protein